MPPLYELRNCGVNFGNNRGLYPIDLTVNTGDFLVISGPSGSGKSTLLSLLTGFLAPSDGDIYFCGKILSESSLSNLRNKIAARFQSEFVQGETVREVLNYPFSYRENRKQVPSLKKIQEIMNAVCLDYLDLSTTTSTLSGGERQRLGLASTLLLEREILILDEITSALDPKISAHIFDLLAQSKTTVLAVSHDRHWIEHAPNSLVLEAINGNS